MSMTSFAHKVLRTLLLTAAVALPPAWGAAAEAPAPRAADDRPDAADLMRRMKSALEPQRDSVRELEIVVRGPLQVESRWQALEARQHRDGRNRLAIVITAPPELRGVALLFDETADAPGVEYHYLPVTRRVRQMKPVGRFQPFLGTDFTYADIGLLPLENRRFESKDETVIDGNPVYQVVEIPRENFYYGKVINWISIESLLPVRRDFHAPSGLHWKREHFEEVVEIDGVPVPTRVRMVDVLEDESSEIETKSVRFGPVPDTVFEPSNLPKLIDHSVWKQEK